MTTRPGARLGSALLTLALTSALTATALLAAPSPARADSVLSAETSANASVAYHLSSPTCVYNGTPVPAFSANAPFPVDGSTVTRSASYSGVVSNNSVMADRTTAAASTIHNVSASQVGGGLSRVSVDDTLQATADPALGTAQACNTEADASADTIVQLELTTPRWAHLQIDSRGVDGRVDLHTMMAHPSGSETDFFGAHYERSESVYLPAGVYSFDVSSEVQADAPTPGGGDRSLSGHLTVTLDLSVPGTPTTSQKGSGGKYVGLAAARSCTGGSLAATWTAKAGKGKHAKVKKATFYVNGAKARTVKKPKRTSVTTLTALAPDQAADVLVKLKLAKKGAGTVTVERSYLPCS